MSEENKKTNLSEEDNNGHSAETSSQLDSPAPLSPAAQPKPIKTEEKPAKETDKLEPVAETKKPATSAPPLYSASAKQSKPAAESTKPAEAEEKSVVEADKPAINAGNPATEAVQAETIKEESAPKTEQILSAKSEIEPPQNIEVEQAPELAPSLKHPQQQPQPKIETPAPASAGMPAGKASKTDKVKIQTGKPAPAPPLVSPPVSTPNKDTGATRPAPFAKDDPAPKTEQIPFIVKFKNKLTELRQQANRKRAEKTRKNLEKIMLYAQQKQKIINDDVEKITGVKDRQALKYLKKLVKQGRLIRFGRKRNTFYKPISK